MGYLRETSAKFGAMQIILAWPLRKDDDAHIEKCKQLLPHKDMS